MSSATHAESFDELLDRLAPGESLEAFALRAGVASRTVWRWRTGRSPRPQRGAMSLVADALHCSIARVRDAIEASRA